MLPTVRTHLPSCLKTPKVLRRLKSGPLPLSDDEADSASTNRTCIAPPTRATHARTDCVEFATSTTSLCAIRHPFACPRPTFAMQCACTRAPRPLDTNPPRAPLPRAAEVHRRHPRPCPAQRHESNGRLPTPHSCCASRRSYPSTTYLRSSRDGRPTENPGTREGRWWWIVRQPQILLDTPAAQPHEPEIMHVRGLRFTVGISSLPPRPLCRSAPALESARHRTALRHRVVHAAGGSHRPYMLTRTVAAVSTPTHAASTPRQPHSFSDSPASHPGGTLSTPLHQHHLAAAVWIVRHVARSTCTATPARSFGTSGTTAAHRANSALAITDCVRPAQPTNPPWCTSSPSHVRQRSPADAANPAAFAKAQPGRPEISHVQDLRSLLLLSTIADDDGNVCSPSRSDVASTTPAGQHQPTPTPPRHRANPLTSTTRRCGVDRAESRTNPTPCWTIRTHPPSNGLPPPEPALAPRLRTPIVRCAHAAPPHWGTERPPAGLTARKQPHIPEALLVGDSRASAHRLRVGSHSAPTALTPHEPSPLSRRPIAVQVYIHLPCPLDYYDEYKHSSNFCISSGKGNKWAVNPVLMDANEHLGDLQETAELLEQIASGQSTEKAAETIRPFIEGLYAQQESIRRTLNTQEVKQSGSTSSPSPPGLLYGMPLSGVQPVEPVPGEFVWAEHEYVSPTFNDDLPLVQEPPVCPPAPPGYAYPEARPFFLEANPAYKRGTAYWNDFRVVDKPLIRRRLLCTINLPQIDPTFDAEGNFILKDLPGMTRMHLGVPYIQRVDGNANHTVTVAVAHTSTSLRQFGDGIAERVTDLEKRLYLLAFGSNPKCPPEETISGLYKLGLKRNDHSAKPTAGSTDGSYSLASTVEKGQGQGCFQPAVQTATPMAQTLISEALVVIHELQQLILPCCLSKFEWEMYKWWAKDNNVFVFGGLGPGATGLQMNSSSGMGGLDTAIGSLQGKWHADISDAPPLWTLGILMLKLPPGSDPGPFMLGRSGLYIRETGILIIYLLFRGNDLHSGFHPSYIEDKRKAWIAKEAVEAVYDMAAPQDRFFFVPYPTQVAYSRAAELAVSPPLTFGNLGAPVYHKLHAKNFSQDGYAILGSHRDRFTRLSREIIWGTLNALAFAGLELTIETAELFRHLQYVDEDGKHCTIEPPDMHDLKHDAAYITKMRGHLAWHFVLSERYLIRITKDGYQTVQACLALRREAQEQIFPLVERRMIQPTQLAKFPGEPEFLISEVVRREVSEGEVMWSVRVENQDNVMIVPEGQTEWLYHPKNRDLIADFIRRHIPLNSAPLRQLYQRLLMTTAMAPAPPPIPSAAASDALSHPSSPNVFRCLIPQLPNLSSSLIPQVPAPRPRFYLMEDIRWEERHWGPQSPDAPPRENEAELSPNVVEDICNGIVPAETTLPRHGEGMQGAMALRPRPKPSSEEDTEGSPSISSPLPLDEDEFEIENVVDYSNENNQQRWCVHWKGYSSADDSWLEADKFGDAKVIFDNYNTLHGIVVDTLHDIGVEGGESDDDSLASGSEFGGPNAKRRRKRPKKPPQSSEDGPLHPFPTQQSFKPCLQLMSSSMLRTELNSLKEVFAAVNSSHTFKIVNPSTVLTQLFELNETNNVIASYLQFDDSVTDFSASVRLAQLQQVVGLADPLCTALYQTDILKHAIQWELCRTLLVVYIWLKDTAPKLVSALILAHRRGGDTLAQTFASYARITEHVVLYVEEIQQTRLAKDAAKEKQTRGRKKAKLGSKEDIQGEAAANDPDPATLLLSSSLLSFPPEESDEPANETPITDAHQPDVDAPVDAPEAEGGGAPDLPSWPPRKLKEIPPDLYGLRAVSGKAKHVQMPEFSGRIFAGHKFIDQAAGKILLELLCRELAVAPMARVDAHWNSSRRRVVKDLKAVQARLISRGAVLKTLVDACENEGILISNALFPVLTSPTALFPINLSNDQRFMKAVIDDEYGTMAPLRTWLESQLAKDPELPEVAQELASFIHHRTLELQQRHLISDGQLLNPNVLLPEQQPLVPNQKAARAANLKSLPVISLSVSQLIPDLASRTPNLFAIPALILREALNKDRELPVAIQSLRWILDGMNPNTGRASHANLDHVNPAHARSRNLQLLKTHIPGDKATTAVGLSNLLAWMLTGQGFSTQSFLTANRFFFESPAECIGCFDEARRSNEAIVAAYRAQHPNAQLHAMKNMQGYLVLNDANVWGQAANDLCLTPTIRYSNGLSLSIAAKVNPYFTPELQMGWTAWLGALAGEDPATYQGSRHSWREAMDMIKSLGISGVKGDGLTTLQMANNLVFLQLCTAPTAADVGAWIAENPGLGAYRGLVLLGFKLHLSDPLATRAAFQIVYDHCERFLTAEDKEALGFGAIFVEHLLCKVQRWQDRYNSAMSESFLTLAEREASAAPPWISGANMDDCKAFPFPLGVDEQRLKEIIRDVMVNFIYVHLTDADLFSELRQLDIGGRSKLSLFAVQEKPMRDHLPVVGAGRRPTLSFLHGQQRIEYKRYHGLPSAGAALGDLAETPDGWRVFTANGTWNPVTPGDKHPDIKNLMKLCRQYKVLSKVHKWGSQDRASKKRKVEVQDEEPEDPAIAAPTVPENQWAFELYQQLVQNPFDHPNEEAKSVILAVLEALACYSSVISCLATAPVVQPPDTPFPSIEAVVEDLIQGKTVDYEVLGQGGIGDDDVSVFLTKLMFRRAQDPLVACMSVDATLHGMARCRLDFAAMLSELGPDVAIRSNTEAFSDAELSRLVPLTSHEPSKTCERDYGSQRRKDLKTMAQRRWVSAGICPAGWITGLHIDHSGLGQQMVHCGGKKLWLFWPPTVHNLKWWGRRHPVDLNLRQVLTAIEVLDGLTVVLVEDRCSFILPPFSLHTVISFTAAAHVGIIFAHDTFWPEAQVGLDFIKELVRDHRAYGSLKARHLVEAVADELPLWNRLQSRRGADGIRQWLSDTQDIYDSLVQSAGA
ncbi:hypothetical protein DFH06DRAFT_1142756 [Mycena polygramma]|nr:hypothetical protein DFH06DRAFT_1142756 [Mycena polygramma]